MQLVFTIENGVKTQMHMTLSVRLLVGLDLSLLVGKDKLLIRFLLVLWQPPCRFLWERGVIGILRWMVKYHPPKRQLSC